MTGKNATIKTLKDLGVAVRSMENTETLKSAVGILRTDKRIDWNAIRTEAKESCLADPVSLEKNFYHTVVKRLSTPNVWKRGGDHSSLAYRVKEALSQYVQAVDDDTATDLACIAVTNRFRLTATPETETARGEPPSDTMTGNIDNSDEPKQKRMRTSVDKGSSTSIDTCRSEGDGDASADEGRDATLDISLLQHLIQERENSVDRWKARKAQSAEYVVAVRDGLRRRNVSHLDLRPVYLGHCAAYCDWPDVASTGQLRRHIVGEFRRMTDAVFEFHPLAPYFERAADGGGFVPKTYAVNGRSACVFQIDHVLPKYWALGLDLPLHNHIP